MSIAQSLNNPWTRKHDDPRFPLLPSVPRTVYPINLQELIELCRDHPSDQNLHPNGSHWALSHAALSDHTYIETHDPGELHQAMGRTLTNVIPYCLNHDYVRRMVEIGREQKYYLVHVESGKRIYQTYAELDQPINIGTTDTLAGYIAEYFEDYSYGGLWGMPTLGGAGGQTIVGALITGTHGGDHDRGPVCEAVVAMHLVADGGKHYWIEWVDENEPQMTDDAALKQEFGTPRLGGPDNFEIIRDNNIFNAVLISNGRFGVLYSVVLKVVPQYSLYERRRLHIWQDIKDDIKNLTGPLYQDVAIPPGATYVPSTPVTGEQRFLQIAVSLTTHAFFTRNLVGITKRWDVQLPNPAAGRDERVGNLVIGFDPVIQAPRYENAGRNFSYSPDPDNPHQSGTPGMLEKACADASFLKGVIQAVIDQIEEFVATNGAVIGPAVGAIAIAGGGGLLLLIPAFLLVLLILREILDAINDDTRFGEVMEAAKNKLLDSNEPDKTGRAAGLFAWQMIYYIAFQSQQSDRDYDAISYAVMDQKDYRNISCEVNVDSVEVFFDAVDDRLIAFVDALINFEMQQEFQGKAFVGYASLRFMRRTKALIGMQKFDMTCSVEVACLRDVSGSQELVDYAVRLARNPNMGAILHWGQRNDYQREEVERIWGDGPLNPGGDLGNWRAALRYITNDGALNGFSSEFTRRTGLEPF